MDESDWPRPSYLETFSSSSSGIGVMQMRGKEMMHSVWYFSLFMRRNLLVIDIGKGFSQY
jgi:hypothetical protein